MGSVQGPEKVKDTCMKTMPVEMMDRGFTVQLNCQFIFPKGTVCFNNRKPLIKGTLIYWEWHCRDLSLSQGNFK